MPYHLCFDTYWEINVRRLAGGSLKSNRDIVDHGFGLRFELKMVAAPTFNGTESKGQDL